MFRIGASKKIRKFMLEFTDSRLQITKMAIFYRGQTYFWRYLQKCLTENKKNI